MRGDGGRFTTPPPSRLEAHSSLRRQNSCSFDHLVGAGEEGRRKDVIESFGRPQVEEELELHRLFHG